MSLNITLYYFSSNYGIVLLTKNLISKKVKVMGVVALLNIVLNIIFIPIFDLNAALFSTIVCNLIIAFSYYFLANREIKDKMTLDEQIDYFESYLISSQIPFKKNWNLKYETYFKTGGVAKIFVLQTTSNS